jgi:hypothetical protein
MSWPKIIYFLVIALAFAGSFFAVKNRKYILFIPLIGFVLIVEVLRQLIGITEVDKSILLFAVIVEYSLLSWILSNFIQSNTKRRIIIASIFVLVPVFILMQLTLMSKGDSYRYLNQMIQAPFICVWTVFYLFEAAKNDEEVNITKNPMFWISLGNLLFYSGSFFSYGFGSYLLSKGSTQSEAIFWIARILNILLYIFYFIGFLCLQTKRLYLSRS